MVGDAYDRNSATFRLRDGLGFRGSWHQLGVTR